MASSAVFSELCDQSTNAYTSLTDTQKRLVDEIKNKHLENYEDIRKAIVNNYDDIGEKSKEVFDEMNFNSKTIASDMIAQWNSEDGTNSVKGAFRDTFDTIIGYVYDFKDSLIELQSVSNTVITDKNGLVGSFDTLSSKIGETGAAIGNLVSNSFSQLDLLRGYVLNVADAWDTVSQKVVDATNKIQKADNSKSTTAPNNEVANKIGTAATNAIGVVNSTISTIKNKTGGDIAKAKSGSKKYTASDIEGILGNIWIYGEWGNGNARKKLLKQKFGDTEGEVLYKEIQNRLSSGAPTLSHSWDYYKNYGPSAFYTGGYTGDWGNQNGKIALLHQKELVLNADDTENMLEAVQMVRDISKLNNSIGNTISGSIRQLITSVLGVHSPSYEVPAASNNTSNVFNITAEFPNADDVSTIKEAILSLPNLASQYVHES